MPELPEVQRVVDTLRPMLLRRVLVHVAHLRDDMITPSGFAFASSIAGRRIAGVDRRAKRVVVTLDSGDQFFIHLGMTGLLSVTPPESARANHTHLIVDLDDGRQLRFVDPRRFGEIRWLGTAGHVGVGPEPLTLRAAALAKQLARTRRSIKTALLDQALVAGIGNIYADEALFAAGIHPTRIASGLTIDEVRSLSASIKRTLGRAIRAGGSTLRDYRDANGDAGAFQKRHRVYDRAGEPCVRCRTAIERIALGGRSTCFCPTCQRAS